MSGISGDGAVLTDADGREYIDGLAGLMERGRGSRAAGAGPGASGADGATGLLLRLRRKLQPPGHPVGQRISDLTYPSISRFFFTSGGGESTESCVKTSRYYWKLLGYPNKTKVISRQWGYHGVTLAAMSATGSPPTGPCSSPRVPGFIHIPSPYPTAMRPRPAPTRPWPRPMNWSRPSSVRVRTR